MSNLPRLLAVEDDPGIARLLRTALVPRYALQEATTVSAALIKATETPPDLVLLDLGLPDHDGLEFLRDFRIWSKAPVIVLSARQREDDKVRALDGGADDYLTKPFGTAELLARVGAALRRGAQGGQDVGATAYRHAGLIVDFAAHRVFRERGTEREELHLTATEFRVLALLARHAGRVLTHAQILHEIWGPSRVDEHHYLRVYVGTLRRKIEYEPARPLHLLTELGVGYRMADADPPVAPSHLTPQK